MSWLQLSPRGCGDDRLSRFSLLDPFNGINSFTGLDDGLEAAYVSPLVREIDVFGELSTVMPGDFDLDLDVDGRDFLAWQRGGSPNPLSATDLADWRANYGTGSLMATSNAVPEPSTWVMISLTVMVGKLARLRRTAHRFQKLINA